MTFLETVRTQYNQMRARHFAKGSYEGVTVAGLAVVRLDGGVSVLLAKRSYDESDEPEVRETWEWPGGHLQPDEDPFVGASREFHEEIGVELPPGDVLNGWRSEDGHYQGFVYEATEFPGIDKLPLSSEVQAVGWFTQEEVEQLGDELRPEVRSMDWSIIWDVSRNEDDMADDADTTDAEPELTALAVTPGTVYVHGVLAPENVESGDSRGFNEGALTARPLKLPLGWQKFTADGHDQAVTVGSIDRMMRKDGLIHWEGSLMDTKEADDFTALVAHFGRYGVSIDGDRGSLDRDRSNSEGMTWFEAARISGAVACSIPAFAEAYVSLGPHPDMPEDMGEEAMVASGVALCDMRGQREAFDRGPGWVTNPKETSRIHEYWTKKGQPGYEKIAWGTPGDFRRARALIGEKIAANSPEKMRFLNQIIAQWHFDALGYWPGDHARMEKAKASNGEGSDSIEAADDTGSPPKWESVLVSSVSGNRIRPSRDYFQRHPDTDALVIEKPDERGLRRTYGYAGEWGVCHRGIKDRCVMLPPDKTGGYREFHLGATELNDGTLLRTGVLTYGVGHRDAGQILTESATQAHYDNLKNAWASVRIGEDEHGIWFSGVVLPHVSDDDLTLIQASGQLSGEWERGVLITLLTVNTPGFPVERSSAAYDEDGRVVALAASAFAAVDNGVGDAPCVPTPAERMQAMAQVDAEVRWDSLRRGYEIEYGRGVV